MTMRTKYCKKQLKAAKTVVMVSGLILVALWATYFAYPAIFKNVKVDFIPSKIPGLSYIFSQTGNSSDISSTPIPNIQSNGTVEDVEVKTDSKEQESVRVGLNESKNATNDKSTSGSETKETNKNKSVYEKVNSTGGSDIATSPTKTTHQTNNIKIPGTTPDVIDALGNIPPPDAQKHTTVVKDPDEKDDANTYTTTSSQIASMTQGDTNKFNAKDGEEKETTNDVDNATQTNITNARFSTDNPMRQDTGTPKRKVAEVTTKALKEKSLSVNEFEKATKSSPHKGGATVGASEEMDNNVTLKLEEVGGISTPKHVAKEIHDWDTSKDSPYINMNLRISERPINHTILLWNAPDWIKVASVELDMGDCSYKNCKLTTNYERIGTGSAVVFYDFDEDYNSIQKRRQPGQVWILHNLLPLDTEPFPDSINGVFNWTWTYRMSSDIFHSYGALFSKAEIQGKSYKDVFRRKTVSAMFYSDSCSIPARLKDTISELRRYIPVDTHTSCDGLTPKDIDKLVNDKYTFYLGFENILCKDYITDQFFHFFGLDVVVVVMGWGQYNHLPRDSFIKADDFPTVGQLAEYLTDLGSNEDTYIRYLKNKDRFETKEKAFTFKNSLCNVCEKLNNLVKNQKVYTQNDLKESLGHC